MPDMFKEAGYQTAVIGKWHMGLGDGINPVDWNGEVKPGPLDIGFDYSYIVPSTNDRVPCVYLDGYQVDNLDPADPLYVADLRHTPKPEVPDHVTQYPYGLEQPEAETYYEADDQHSGTVIRGISRIGWMAGGKSALWDDETMADVLMEKTHQWIAANKDEPFFLYYASQDIHVPRAPHKRFQGTTGLGFRGDAMVQMDWTVGAIMDALDQHGLSENTIVIFSSDNGPVYDDGYMDGSTVRKSSEESDHGHDGSGIYRGGKYQPYEGGTRVPFILRWPAKVAPGTVSDALVTQLDFLSTFANMLAIDIAPDNAIDSQDAYGALFGQEATGRAEIIEEAGKNKLSLRQGTWKLLHSQRGNKVTIELYDLAADPSEQNNLVEAHPERVEAMRKRLDEIREGRLRQL